MLRNIVEKNKNINNDDSVSRHNIFRNTQFNCSYQGYRTNTKVIKNIKNLVLIQNKT